MIETCEEFAASFIPRWGEYFSCVLPKGHEGEHRAGGNCVAHGTYVMEHFGEHPKCVACSMELMNKNLIDAQLDMIKFSLRFPDL